MAQRDRPQWRGDDWYGPTVTSSEFRYGGPGLDHTPGDGPRVDHVGIDRAGGRGVWPVTSSSDFAQGLSARDYGIHHAEDKDFSRALFERKRSSRGPHVLNRSFAGTYRDKK